MRRSELILLYIILLSLTCLGSTTTKLSNKNPKSEHNDNLGDEFNETFADFNQDSNSIYSSSCSVDDDNCLEKNEGSLTLIFTPETKEFGKRFLCTVFQESINVYNPSSKIIHIFSYKVDTNEFSLSLPRGTLSIYPSQSVYIPILFTPLFDGIRKAHIMITTSTGIFNYEVYGEGIKNPYNLAPISLTQIQLGDSVQYDLMISNPKESNKKKIIINDIFVSNDMCSLSIKNTTQEEAWSVTLSAPHYISTLTIQATRSGSFTDYVHIYTSAFHFVVPIEFNINANYITVMPSMLVLKNIILDRVVSTVFNVTNISKQPFHLISTQVFNTGKYHRSYSLEYSYVNVTLQPYESLPLTLEFTPYEPGEFKSYVLLMSNITNNEYRPYYLYYDVVAVNGSIIVKDIYMKINNPITTVQRKTKRAALLKSLCKSYETYEEQRFSIANNYEIPIQILNIFTHTSVSENIKFYIYKNKDYIELTRYFEQYKNINLMPGSIMSNLYLFYFYNYTETANSLHLINFSSSIGSFTRHLFIYTGSLDVYIDNTNYPGMKREITEFPSPVTPDFYVYNSIRSSMKELYNDKMNTHANANLVLLFRTLSFQSQRYKRITFYNNNPVTISYNITIADYPLFTVYLRVVEPQNDLMSEKYIQKDLLPLTPGDVYTYILEPNEYIYFIIKLDLPPRKEFIQRMTTYPSGFITVHSQSPICFSSYINNLITVKHPLQTINFASSFSIPCGDIIITPNPVFINVPYMTRYTSDSLRYMSSISNKTDIYDIYGFSTSLSYSIPIKYMTKNSNSTVINFTYLGRFLYNTYALCYSNLTLNYEYNSNEVRTRSNILDSFACSLFPDLPEFTANKYVNPFTFINYNMIFDMPVSEADIERFVKRLLAYLIVFSKQNGVLEIKDYIMHTSVISHIHIPVVVVPQYISIIQDNGVIRPFNLSASSKSIQKRYENINILSSSSPMESINIPTHILPFLNPVHYTTELKNVSINRAVNIPISLQNPSKLPVVFRIELDNKEDRYHEIFTKYIKNTTIMMNMNKRYSPDYLFDNPLEGQDSTGADMDPSMFLLNPLIPYGILKPNETRIVAFLTFHPSHTGTYAINLYVKNNLTNLEIYRYCGTGVGSDVQMIYKNQQDTQRHDELIMIPSLNNTNISNFTTYLQFTNPSSITDQILGIYVENDIAPYIVVEDIYLNQTLVNGYIIDVPITYLYKCTESFTFTLNVITRFRPLIINITLTMDPNSVILCRQNYMSIHYSYIYEHKTCIVLILSVLCCFFMAAFTMILIKQVKNISYLYNVFPLMKYIHYIQDNVKNDNTYVYSLDGSNGIVLTSNTVSNDSENVQVIEPKNVSVQQNTVSSPSHVSIPKSLSNSSLSTSLDEGTKQLSPLVFPTQEDIQDQVLIQSTNHSNVSTPSGHSKTSQGSISSKKQSRTATKLSGRSQKGSSSVSTNPNINPLSPEDPEFYARMLDNVTQLVYNDNLSNTTKTVENKTPTPTHVVSTRNNSPLVRNTKRSHDNGVASPQRVHTPVSEPIIIVEQESKQESKQEDINLILSSSHSNKDVQIDQSSSTSHENLDSLNPSTISDNSISVLLPTKIDESSVSIPSQSSTSVIVESTNENNTETQSFSTMDSIEITDKKNTTDLDIQDSDTNQIDEETIKSSVVDTVDSIQTQKETCIKNENNVVDSSTVESSSLITENNTIQVSSSKESTSTNITMNKKEIEIVKEKNLQKPKSDESDSQKINPQVDVNEINKNKIHKVNEIEVIKDIKDSKPLNDKIIRKDPISINIKVPNSHEKIRENNKNDGDTVLLESTNELNTNSSSKNHDLMTESSASYKQHSNKKQEVQEELSVSNKKNIHKPSTDSTVSSVSVKQVPIITVNVPSIPKNNIQKDNNVKTVSINNVSSESLNKKNQTKKEKNSKDEKCQEININKETVQAVSNIKTNGLSSPQRSNVVTPKSDQSEKKSKREKKKEKANAKKNSSVKDINIHGSSNPSSRSNSTQPKMKEDKSSLSMNPQYTSTSNHPSSVSSPTLSAHSKAAPYYLKSDPNPLYSDLSMNGSSSLSNSNSNGMRYYNSDEYIPSNDPGYEPIMSRYNDPLEREYPLSRAPYMPDMNLEAQYAYEAKPEYYNRGYDDYYENPNVYMQEPADNYYPSEEYDPRYDKYYNRRVMMNTMSYDEPQNENVIDYIPMIRRDVYAPEQFDGYDPSTNEMNTLYNDSNIDQLCNDQSIGFNQTIDEFNPSHPASILPIDPVKNEMKMNNSNDFCEEDENIDAPLNYDIHNIIKVIDSDSSSSKSRSSSLSLINQAIQTIKDHTNSMSRTTSSKDLQTLSNTEVVKMEINKSSDISKDTKQDIPTDLPVTDQQSNSVNSKQESKLESLKDSKSIPVSTTDITGIETLSVNAPPESTVMESNDVSESKSSSFSSAYNTNVSVASNTMSFQDVPVMHSNSITEANYMYNDPSLTPVSHYAPSAYPKDVGMHPYPLSSGMPPNMNMSMRSYYGTPINRDIPYNCPMNRPVYPPNYYNSIPSYHGQPVYDDINDANMNDYDYMQDPYDPDYYNYVDHPTTLVNHPVPNRFIRGNNLSMNYPLPVNHPMSMNGVIGDRRSESRGKSPLDLHLNHPYAYDQSTSIYRSQSANYSRYNNDNNRYQLYTRYDYQDQLSYPRVGPHNNNPSVQNLALDSTMSSSNKNYNNDQQDYWGKNEE